MGHGADLALHLIREKPGRLQRSVCTDMNSNLGYSPLPQTLLAHARNVHKIIS